MVKFSPKKQKMRSLYVIILGCLLVMGCASKDGVQPAPAGKFTVKIVGKDSITDGVMEMKFDEDADKVSGTAVCNRYNANYTVSNGAIKFSPAASTKMLCPEGSTIEYNFFEALRTATTYELKRGKLKLYKDEKLILVAEK